MRREHREIQSQEPSKKKNQEPSNGTDNRFAQPAAPCQTIQTFMETKGKGVIFFRRKTYPRRAKHSGAQPENSAHRVSAVVPPFLPQQQLPVVERKNFAPFSCGCLQGFVTICSAECFTQNCVTKPGSKANPYTYILILCPAIRAILGRIRQAFQGTLCCSATRFLLP